MYKRERQGDREREREREKERERQRQRETERQRERERNDNVTLKQPAAHNLQFFATQLHTHTHTQTHTHTHTHTHTLHSMSPLSLSVSLSHPSLLSLPSLPLCMSLTQPSMSVCLCVSYFYCYYTHMISFTYVYNQILIQHIGLDFRRVRKCRTQLLMMISERKDDGQHTVNLWLRSHFSVHRHTSLIFLRSEQIYLSGDAFRLKMGPTVWDLEGFVWESFKPFCSLCVSCMQSLISITKASLWQSVCQSEVCVVTQTWQYNLYQTDS